MIENLSMMPNLEKFEIELDNPSRVYMAGNILSGSTLIVLNENIQLRAVWLQISGEANVSFYHHYKSGDRSHTDHYSSKAVYVSHDALLWGNSPGCKEDAKMLLSGTHRFHFQCQLPPTCPNSYEGIDGSIRYFVKVIIDRPGPFDHMALMPFNVVELHDLNLDPRAALSVQNSGRKTFFFASGDLRATVSIPRMGYVPGEIIPISAQIENTTKRSLKRIEVKLIQTVKFTGHHLNWARTNDTTKIVAKIQTVEDIPGGKTTVWTNEPLPIPTVPPMLRNCFIINITYCLDFVVVPHGLSFDLDVKIPIIIGTIPLSQQVQPSMNVSEPMAISQGATTENQIIQISAPLPAPPPRGDMYP